MKKHFSPKTDAWTKIVRNYCVKYPSAGNRTLARMMLDEHPTCGLTLEQLRSRFRARRGALGIQARFGMHNTIERAANPFALPDSHAEEWKPVQFTGRGRGVVLADLHIPYHDMTALTATLHHTVSQGLTDFIVMNGDVLDYYGLSFFSHDPTKPRFTAERDAWFRFADVMRDIVGDTARIVFKAGNHDLRFERYMIDHAAELYGMEDFRLPSVLRLDQWGIEYVKAEVPIYVGKLNVLHGHEFGGGSANTVNAARTAFLRTGECTVVGHGHRASEHSETTLRERLVTCWSLGCLCELHPQYRPINKWNHGFAELIYDGKEDFTVRLRRVLKGRVL